MKLQQAGCRRLRFVISKVSPSSHSRGTKSARRSGNFNYRMILFGLCTELSQQQSSNSRELPAGKAVVIVISNRSPPLGRCQVMKQHRSHQGQGLKDVRKAHLRETLRGGGKTSTNKPADCRAEGHQLAARPPLSPCQRPLFRPGLPQTPRTREDRRMRQSRGESRLPLRTPPCPTRSRGTRFC